jgi:hypothetical protein
MLKYYLGNDLRKAIHEVPVPQCTIIWYAIDTTQRLQGGIYILHGFDRGHIINIIDLE